MSIDTNTSAKRDGRRKNDPARSEEEALRLAQDNFPLLCHLCKTFAKNPRYSRLIGNSYLDYIGICWPAWFNACLYWRKGPGRATLGFFAMRRLRVEVMRCASDEENLIRVPEWAISEVYRQNRGLPPKKVRSRPQVGPKPVEGKRRTRGRKEPRNLLSDPIESARAVLCKPVRNFHAKNEETDRPSFEPTDPLPSGEALLIEMEEWEEGKPKLLLALNQIPVNIRFCIVNYFGLEGIRKKSYSEIGKMLKSSCKPNGVSRERVRQLIDQGIEQLAKILNPNEKGNANACDHSISS